MRIINVTREEAERLHKRFCGFPSNSEYRGQGGFSYFVRAITDSILVVEYEFGMVRFNDYKPNNRVRVHALFDSKEVFRHINDLTTLALYVFDHLRIQYIEAIIPDGMRALSHILMGVGFDREGESEDGIIYRMRRR